MIESSGAEGSRLLPSEERQLPSLSPTGPFVETLALVLRPCSESWGLDSLETYRDQRRTPEEVIHSYHLFLAQHRPGRRLGSTFCR